ncbi:SDR family NAD(P)-dependent oxidoreductase [Psychrobacter sp. FDAARGOS_221]|uniref:SDR family NAD(P)-dependent oxidoreductase n=1 Tax=Psychrobacter sp. FDAARGOS_221 TaxID=1975705 RepID=UPI000BB58F29|nr:SDR family NAD(P)-dependent oxidoreductase [Psychrobacter sp. FDAARGOS_221]PNK59790.1 KR domain-containing protein [Psychrobacter sp. FDAARGOS_221]
MYKSTLSRVVKNKNIIITGGSSGIGESTAYMLAAAGAHVILIARSMDKLQQVQAKISAFSGKASVYSCDLTDTKAIEKTVRKILKEHKHVDILVNNAGRSIRRSINESLDRFHDFERTMDINYFGAVKLVLELMPSMLKRKKGHIINISSIGVLANTPRFSAYVASKAALDAFSRCIAAEVKGKKVNLTSIYMPLVRTPMIAPTKMYNYMPALSPQEAADLVAKAIIEKPVSISSNMGRFASATYALVPKFNLGIQSLGFRLFPDFKSAKRKKSKPNILQRAFARILPGEPH